MHFILQKHIHSQAQLYEQHEAEEVKTDILLPPISIIYICMNDQMNVQFLFYINIGKNNNDATHPYSYTNYYNITHFQVIISESAISGFLKKQKKKTNKQAKKLRHAYNI